MGTCTENFWTNLETVLEEKGYSWSRLARETGIERVNLVHAKSYRNSPQLERIVKIAEALDVSVDELIKPQGSSVGKESVAHTHDVGGSSPPPAIYRKGP